MPKVLAVATATGLAGILWWLANDSPDRARSQTFSIVALSCSSEWIASGTSDGRIQLCNIRTGVPACRTFQSIGTLNDLRFSPSARQLAIADKNIRMVPLPGPGEPLGVRGDGENYGSVRFSSDGRVLLTVNGYGAILAVDLVTGKAETRFCCSSIWGDVEFSADESRILFAGHWPGVWDVHSGRLAQRLTPMREFMAFGPIAADPVSGAVYMGSQDGRVYQRDMIPHRLIRKSPALSGYVRSIAVLGTSGWMAYAGQGGPVHLWNPETGESRVVRPAWTTSNLVFDPASGQTALGTSSGNVEFWDLRAARLVRKISLPNVEHR